jgi:UDP-N-acetylmuramyl tripeptide synthase
MVAAGWTRAFGGATAAKHLVLNADDPVLAGLAGTTSAQVSLFGLEDINGAPTRPEHGADPRRCPVCGGPLEYSAAFFGHVGHYVCANRDWQRPRPDVSGDDVEHSGLDGTTFRLSTPRGSSLVRLSIGGLYNVHNALAAAAGGLAVGASLGNVHRGLEQARPAFGRLQQVQVAGKRVRMLLIKNPVGATAVFRAAYEAREPGALLIALNDNIADGTDVSWIWDVDFSTVASHETKLVVSGVRAEDLAVRLKYAGVPAERMHVESNLAKALGYAVEVTPAARELLIMPTYTAMLELQAIVQRLGAAPSYWEAVHREW